MKPALSLQGTVCGLCGNFDSRSSNDFTTRDHMVVESELDFGNSWKEAPTCPDVSSTPEPCLRRPHRRAWAEKQCSLIKSPVFSSCHSKVDPKPFYEACVHDSCSCDSGGDCECFCSAVATYAQECTKEAACVYWRTPDLCRECLPPTWGPPLGGGQHCPPIPGRACAVLPCCPRPRTPGSGEDPRLTPLHPCLAAIFCDYYNPPNECEWHYEPCGNRSFETCRTLSGIHSNISVSHLEGEWPAPGVPLSQALGGLGAGGLRV